MTVQQSSTYSKQPNDHDSLYTLQSCVNINYFFQANLGEKEELTFEEFRTVMAAYKKDIEKANLAVTQT